jgi:hypothetical protein
MATAPTVQEIEAIKNVIASYGLMDLWKGVQKYIDKGYNDAADIMYMVSIDPQYEEVFFKRFPAIKQIRAENVKRSAAGQPIVPEVTAAEYISNEYAYSQAVTGLPNGDEYLSKDNITKWISGDVSPTEVKNRIDVAWQYIEYNSNPQVRDELRRIYGLSDADMVNYVLSSPDRQEKLLAQFQERTRQANVGAAAKAQGIGMSDSLRNEVAAGSDQAYSYGNASAVFSNIAAEGDSWRRLGDIDGTNISDEDLTREAFSLAGGSDTTKTKRKLASRERARFGGSSGLSARSLSSGGLGSQ